jgi:hypothetical protein
VTVLQTATGPVAGSTRTVSQTGTRRGRHQLR